MQQRTKTLLLLMSVFIFFLIAPVVLLYAQGYRFSISREEFALTRTGGIAVTSLPRGAKIKFGDKFAGTTPFFDDGITPGQYRLSLSKKGYQNWTGTVQIEPNRVVVLEDVILIPAPEQFVKQEGVLKLSFAPQGTALAVIEEGAPRVIVLRSLLEAEAELKLELEKEVSQLSITVQPKGDRGLLAVSFDDNEEQIYQFSFKEKLLAPLLSAGVKNMEYDAVSFFENADWEDESSLVSAWTDGGLLRFSTQFGFMKLPKPRGYSAKKVYLRGRTLYLITQKGELVEISPRASRVLIKKNIFSIGFQEASPEPQIAFNSHELFLLEKDNWRLLARFNNVVKKVFVLSPRHFLAQVGDVAYLISLVERDEKTAFVRVISEDVADLSYTASKKLLHLYSGKGEWLSVQLDI